MTADQPARKSTKKPPVTKKRAARKATAKTASRKKTTTLKAVKKKTAKKAAKKKATTKVVKKKVTRKVARKVIAKPADANRRSAAKRSRMMAAGEREIGPIPPVADPKRRAACERDMPLALKTYFGPTFPLPFSSQHLEVIETMRLVFQEGGLFALGMPRGSGKTSIVIRCALLAMLMGWRRFMVFIGSVQSHASDMLNDFKAEIETNDLLLADFPEVCFPIRALEYSPSRARGQTTQGAYTLAKWDGAKRIVMPTFNDVGGGVVVAVGINNKNIRGTKHRLITGEIIRPDAFGADDLQDSAVARNVDQVDKLESIINGDVMGMAGPGQPMAGVATITVQRRGDLADRLLDRALNVEWKGKRFALVDQWPTNERLWAEYAELRDLDLATEHSRLPKATKFYARNRIAMDKGAVVAWPERFTEHELSAIQHAQNLRLKSPATFDAEYQNAPSATISAEGVIVAPDSNAIVHRIGGYARGEVPVDATRLFCGVDVQKDVLYWLIAAVDESLTGWVVDYGAWPDQPSVYWTLKNVNETIQQATGIGSLDGSLSEAYRSCIPTLMNREFVRDDGATMSIERLVIDANWGPSTKSVYSFVRQSGTSTILPFHGRGVTAKQNPFAARKKKRGEQAGVEWFVPIVKGTRTPRHVIADVNLVKSILAERLLQPMGESGAWQLFKAPIVTHRMLADQWSAEFPIETTGRGRTLHEWMLRPGRDNHYLDCAVMVMTAALMAGCAIEGTAGAAKRIKRRRVRRSLGEAKG